MPFSPIDHHHMRRALELAAQGRYTTHPNPRVGCVIAQGDTIVGEGWHRRAGEAHAEVLALEQAGAAARASTVYVTLEPHCFQGKTPPCTQALIRAGVSRVVCGALDPNPKVNGAGMRQLTDAGILAQSGLLADEARALNAGFEKRMLVAIPRVTVKVAASLDGRVALANGQSKWITSEAARADVQRLRAASSAVLTGIDTVLADDPLLNVRDAAIDMAGRLPLRVVLDSRLRLRPNAKMFETQGPILVAACVANAEAAAALRRTHAEIIELPADSTQRVDLHTLLRELGRRECNEVLVEAGPILTSRFISLGLCDELIVYFAPKLLGGDAKPMLELPTLERIEDGLQFELRTSEPIGPDLKLTLTPRK
jgi:diaminohydroxyphosphoribosylaminopyrimidine deaminase / 5-amino-6-(5-phosphoribosylamino)uracil reductase